MKENKKQYEAPELVIILLDATDIITTSGESPKKEQPKEANLNEFELFG